MICAYNVKSKTYFRKWTQNPLETNENVLQNGMTVEQTITELAECERENCGAWYDGKCNYKGACD